MSNIVASIINYVANVWHNTDQDYVMAEHINAWEQELQNVSQFLSRYAWHPNTAYPKGSVILYPFGLNTKLVSQNAGTSGSNEPTWSDAQGQEGSRTVTDNDITWKEMPMEISSDTTPIGTIKQQLWHTAPPGYLKLDESHVLNRSEYPELWDYVQKYYPLVTEVDWQKQKATQTSVGFFSTGDGETTFRTPILLDFARGGGTPGTYTKDQNKSHKHNGNTSKADLTGSFITNDFTDDTIVPNTSGILSSFRNLNQYRDAENGTFGTGGSYGLRIDASHSHTLTTNNEGGSEVLVKNVIMPFYLRVQNV